MKLPPARINAFVERPDPAVRVILLYGPDTGLVHERGDTIAKKTVADLHDPFRVAALTGSMISEDPGRLLDEMASQALGGGRRLIRVQQAIDSMAAPLALVLADLPASDSLLLIEGGDLEKRSKLRSLCESDAETVVAIACYVEEGPAKQRIVGDILQSEGVNASRDVLAFLSDVLPPDRMAMRSELEKLAIYVKGKSSVTIEDVQAVIQDSGAAELDDLVFAVGLGDSKKARVLMDRLFEEQTSPVAIFRAAQRHFLRLQWARGQMEKGASASEAIKRLQPPVFWKFSDAMTSQLARWPSIKIGRALTRLYDAEAAVKRTGTPDMTLCAQVMLGLSA